MARLSLFAFVFSVALRPNVVESLRVILGEPLEFPENCGTDESGSLEHRFSPHGSREVAVCRGGVWTAGRAYRERISGGSSVVFSRTVYTDNGGAYELTCRDLLGRSREKTVQLEVVVASKVTAAEGEAAVLPCYYGTTGETGLSVFWEKNGTVLLQQELGSEEGGGPAGGRLSVSPGGFSHGDLSLTVKEVQLDDGGDYFCSVGGKDADRSSPAVVRMAVSERNRHQCTSTSPPAHPSACPQWTGTAFFLLACVFLLIGGVIVLGWKLKSRRCGARGQRREPGGGGEPMEVINSSVNEQRRAEETRQSDTDPQSSQPLVSNGHTVTL
ncbi:uncharacterized protein PAE49_021417 [Odontesthes bonariensis]|uniref:uncharacterized protein LOC142368712 n=1 Tax=Odontesthes bonariensis TaxID=219752 RepID=UPI003F583F4E